jgi:hypothetical protein
MERLNRGGSTRCKTQVLFLLPFTKVSRLALNIFVGRDEDASVDFQVGGFSRASCFIGMAFEEASSSSGRNWEEREAGCGVGMGLESGR